MFQIKGHYKPLIRIGPGYSIFSLTYLEGRGSECYFLGAAQYLIYLGRWKKRYIKRVIISRFEICGVPLTPRVEFLEIDIYCGRVKSFYILWYFDGLYKFFGWVEVGVRL